MLLDARKENGLKHYVQCYIANMDRLWEDKPCVFDHQYMMGQQYALLNVYEDVWDCISITQTTENIWTVDCGNEKYEYNDETEELTEV